MLRRFPCIRRVRKSISVALCTSLSACAFGNGDRDIDRNPIVNTGAGASILYPGQAAPTYETGGQFGPRGGSIGTGPFSVERQGQVPGPPPTAVPHGSGSGSSSRSGSPSSGGSTVSFLGGSEQDEVSHAEYNEEPIWFKYAALPFVLAAAPFKAAADAMAGDPEPGPEIPRNTQHSRLPAPSSPQPSSYDTGQSPRSHASSAPAPAPRVPTAPQPRPQYATPGPVPTGPPMDYESVLLRKMERELAVQTPGPDGSSAQPNHEATTAFTIADELAALQRSAPAPHPHSFAATPTPTAPRVPSHRPAITRAPDHDPPPRPAHEADGIVDRNADGRIDHWIYRHDGQVVREVLDDDFDGRAERILHYDLATHRIARVDEDFDHDGAIDSWTDYRDGRVIRRRADASSDGNVDSWTYYRDGEVSRHERDTTGDGFRDHVGYYREGRLAREEQDHDGDGRSEVTVRYDADERITAREEDLDGNGSVDLISRFEHGKLTRREVIDPSAFESHRR